MDEALREQIREYKAPRPRRGQTVIYYPNGIVNDQNAEIGVIAFSGDECCDVTVRGIKYRAIRHVSDPRNKLDPRHRPDGLWDFGEADKELDRRLNDLEKAVEALEQKLKSRAVKKTTQQ